MMKLTLSMTTTMVATMSLLFVATTMMTITPVESFGLGGSLSPAINKSSSSSSPLAADALSSYPYVIKSDEERSVLVRNFDEIARLYGDDEALAMVSILPRALKFDRDNFAPCLESWEEQFGSERARAMVRRNPGLLGVRPEATRGAESSMAFSYVVAAMRPSLIKIVGFVGVLLGAGRQFQEGGGTPF